MRLLFPSSENLLYEMMGGYVFQLPVVLWGNAKRRRREAPPFDLAPPLATMTRSYKGCIPFQSAKRGSRPRRANLACRKTERPRRGGFPDCHICTPYLPRIPGAGSIPDRRWLRLHSPTAPLPVEGWRIPQGLPLKSVGGREQVSLSSALSSRPVCQHRVKGCVDRSASLSITS